MSFTSVSRVVTILAAICLIAALVPPSAAFAQEIAPTHVLAVEELGASGAEDVAYDYILIKPTIVIQRDGRGDLGTEAIIRNTGNSPMTGTQWGINWYNNEYSNIHAFDDVGPLNVAVERSSSGIILTIAFRALLSPNATYHYFFTVNVAGMAVQSGEDWDFSLSVNSSSPAASLMMSVTFPDGATFTAISPVADSQKGTTIIWKRGSQSGNWSFGVSVTYRLNASSAVTPFLDLPINYDGKSFDIVTQNNPPGKVNSWFDHQYPLWDTSDPEITLWTGAIATGSLGNCANDSNYLCYGSHNGIDFQHNYSLTDEPVYAAARGVVAQVCTNYTARPACPRGLSYGNYVLIDHGNGYATFYGHLKSVDAKVDHVGAPVEDHQQVGIMGGTPKWKTHLHFGVYYDASAAPTWNENLTPVDPYGWSGSYPDPASKGDARGVFPPSTYLWRHQLGQKTIIDASGGTAATPANNVRVQAPASATTQDLLLELLNMPPVAAPSAQLRSIGSSFQFNLSGSWQVVATGLTSGSVLPANLNAKPMTLTVNYDDAQVVHLDEQSLVIQQWNDTAGAWSTLPTQADTELNLLTALVDGPGNFDVQGPLACPQDATEADDDYDHAVPIAVIYAKPFSATRVLDSATDQDWMQLDLHADTEYVFTVEPSVVGIDVVASLYDSSGVQTLAVQDGQGSGASEVLGYTAATPSSAFVVVSGKAGADYGCNAAYTITVEQVGHSLYLPAISR